MSEAPMFVGEHVLAVGGTRFHYEHPLRRVPEGHLGIEKLRPLLEAYLALWADLRPRHVVELGIHSGGSTALLAELGVDRVASIELSATRVAALDRFVAERGMQDVVRPYYGVDQADRSRVAEIVDEEFGDAPLDLVIDDASHRYAESKASFEVLYPRVRPGGAYLLEDWRWQHMVAAQMAAALARDDPAMQRRVEERMIAEDRIVPETPMSRLVLELVLLRAVTEDLVADITVGPDWAVVRRGPAELDPSELRLDELATDHAQLLRPVR